MRDDTGHRGLNPVPSFALGSRVDDGGAEDAITITLTRTPSISAREAAQALRTALSRGGDWAELFWERHETLQIVLDDGHVEDAISGFDQGAGIRVTKGERTTYAKGNLHAVPAPL